MPQQQGVMAYNAITKKPCLLAADSPLYMNYRCNVYQVRQARPLHNWVCNLHLQLFVPKNHSLGITLEIGSLVCVCRCQSSCCIRIFDKFEHLAETVQPTAASLKFVQTVCAQAEYYCASEEDYQHVMRRLWSDLLFHLGGVS